MVTNRLRNSAPLLPAAVSGPLARAERLARRRVPYPVWGNLRRRLPFSAVYGRERGTPADRIYLTEFLLEHLASVSGRVLEMETDEWSQLAPPGQVVHLEVLDVDAGNPRATIVADLSADALPGGPFDCEIVFQTLQYVSSPERALKNLWACLSPGGTLLVSVPVISRLDHMCGLEGDLWRFTPAGLRALISNSLPEASLLVRGYGSLAVATAFLQGIAAEEVGQRAYEWHDDRFPVVACAAVSRSAASP